MKEQQRAQFDAHLEQWSASLPQDALHAPMRYIMGLPAKRVRPMLTILAAELFGGSAADVMNEALGIELFHNFTLMHDDIMDRSIIRRGMPTVHEKWNVNTAILSGDAMLVRAYQCMGADPAVLSIFNADALAVCEGQQRDMDFEQKAEVTLDDYREMIRLKTAVLLSCALRIGACKAGATKEDQDRIGTFGEQLGLAFQLRDDLLDAFGDPTITGKERGGDLRNGKKTWLLIRALEASALKGDNTLHKELGKPVEQRDVAIMLDVLGSLGIQREAEEEVDRLEQSAFVALDAIQVPSEQKTDLRLLVDQLRSRVS